MKNENDDLDEALKQSKIILMNVKKMTEIVSEYIQIAPQIHNLLNEYSAHLERAILHNEKLDPQYTNEMNEILKKHYKDLLRLKSKIESQFEYFKKERKLEQIKNSLKYIT